MDAAHLAFPDARFDAVYAPYVINIVADPVRVGREMRRVCRPGGRIVLLNHFDPLDRPNTTVNRTIGHLASAVCGANWNLDLRAFLHDAGLALQSVEAVNIPRVSSVVLCRIGD
jgi:phosphatidylethanolamine/phosphatidyl-N-methylethanolamine N-methyltransferase